jgi:sugar lactone lactonase YvrE
MKTVNTENIAALGLECGEAPVWVPEKKKFYFVDTEQRFLYSYSAETGKIRTYPVPFQFQCIARRKKGGWIGTVVRGAALWDPDEGSCRFLGNPEEGKSSMLVNDGTVTPAGEFVFGTYDVENLEEPKGNLFLMDEDFHMHLLEPGFAVPNGMAFGPDGKSFYISEQFASRVLRFEWDPKSKKLTNREVFAEFTEEQGMPDGLIIDDEGFIWVAHWQGWRVTRFNPAGGIDLEIPLPVTTATCMVFAGKNLDELYITTAKKCVEDADMKRGPEAGDLFKAAPGCRGRLENLFIG